MTNKVELARERQRAYASVKRANDREAYNAYMREWNSKNRDRLNEARREKLKTDPEYANKVRARDRARPKDRIKNNRIKSDYGITLETLNRMLESQSHCCAICGIHEKDAGKKGLAIDHCHSVGHVRGLLCSHCNTGIGQFRDSVSLLEKAIEYLKG